VEQSSDALVAISAIEGFSANDIYLARTTPVLRSGFLEHFDGSSWQPVLETTYSVVMALTLQVWGNPHYPLS
jgi:hypothetical protein